jgi:FkbM family methyltransferase
MGMLNKILNLSSRLKFISPHRVTLYKKRREFHKDIKKSNSILCSNTLLGKPFYYEPLRTTRSEVFGNSGLKKMFDNDNYNLNVLKKINNPVILDIGSHIGIWPRVIKNKFPDAKIFSLEPDRDNFRILKINNDFLEDVESYQFGIYSHRQIIKMAVSDINSWRSVLAVNEKFFRNELIGNDQFSHDSYDVECVSIDEFVFDKDIRKIDMIGVTIPGEIALNVLHGAIETLKKYKPILSINLYESEYDNFLHEIEKLSYKKLEKVSYHMNTFVPVI